MLAAEFRYVVLDTAPGLSDTTLAALDETTDLVMLTSMDVPGVRGLRKELDALAQIGQRFESRQIVLNFADRAGCCPSLTSRPPSAPASTCCFRARRPSDVDQPGRSAAAERRPGPDDQAAAPAGGPPDDRRPCRAVSAGQTGPQRALERSAGRGQPAPNRSPVATHPEGPGVMTLSERLQAPGTSSSARPPAPSTSATPVTATTAVATAGRRTHAQPSGADALTKLKDRAATAMFDRLGARLNDPSLSEEQLHALVRSELSQVVEEEKVPLTVEQQQRLVRDVQDDVLGHGPLQRLLDDAQRHRDHGQRPRHGLRRAERQARC